MVNHPNRSKPFDSLVREALEADPCRTLASVLARQSLSADARTRERAKRMAVSLLPVARAEYEAARAALGFKVTT